MRNVCVFIGSRANYSSIKSVLRAVRQHPALKLQLIVGASALLDRFGSSRSSSPTGSSPTPASP